MMNRYSSSKLNADKCRMVLKAESSLSHSNQLSGNVISKTGEILIDDDDYQSEISNLKISK